MASRNDSIFVLLIERPVLECADDIDDMIEELACRFGSLSVALGFDLLGCAFHSSLNHILYLLVYLFFQVRDFGKL